MKALASWLSHLIEFLLLGFGLGCLGMYAYESVEARRFQAEQTAVFERDAKTRVSPIAVRRGGLAGHRDGLFRPLKDVKIGDEIRFRTTRDEFRYRVTRTAIVTPDDLSVLAPQPDPATLTLITCYPFYYVGTAPKRFIVHAARE
jgi:LPXTG-site transpeptidase (sortase) family protein